MDCKIPTAFQFSLWYFCFICLFVCLYLIFYTKMDSKGEEYRSQDISINLKPMSCQKLSPSLSLITMLPFHLNLAFSILLPFYILTVLSLRQQSSSLFMHHFFTPVLPKFCQRIDFKMPAYDHQVNIFYTDGKFQLWHLY